MKTKILLIAIVLSVIFSCKKDDPAPVFTLDTLSVPLTHGATHQVKINGSTTEIFNYESDNDLIASVDDKGLITGERVGITKIKVDGNGFTGECAVAIVPIYNTFIEPITSFGLTISEVKAKEKRTFLTEINGAILYKGSLLEDYVMYSFENGKLKSSVVILDNKFTSVLGSYLAERYVIVSTNPVFGYSVDDKFMVGTTLTDDLDWFVMYMAHDGKSASLKSQSISLGTKYQSEFKNLINK